MRDHCNSVTKDKIAALFKPQAMDMNSPQKEKDKWLKMCETHSAAHSEETPMKPQREATDFGQTGKNKKLVTSRLVGLPETVSEPGLIVFGSRLAAPTKT